MPTRPPLAETLPYAADFVIEILATASRSSFGQLSWVEINRLAARWLRPTEGDSSRLGHCVVLEMSAHGLLDIELGASAGGGMMVQRVRHPRLSGVAAGRALAA